MAEDTDGVSETFDESLRIALTIAAQFGERIARLREQMARQREAEAVQEARELQARFEAERRAARASLAPVKESEWWNSATPDDIAGRHETATAWRNIDAVAADAGDRIRDQVQERYGIDVDEPGAADPVTVAAALRDAERDRMVAADEKRRSGEELTASQLLFAEADRRDRDAQEWADRTLAAVDGTGLVDVEDRRQAAEDTSRSNNERDEAVLDYDSFERRQLFVADLDQRGIDKGTSAARMLADGENAKHPREAVTTSPRKAAKAQRGRVPVGKQRERDGLSR